jgi:hypothetical protein
MSERRENSVLFSLKELRNIEEGRVKKEKEEVEARVAAERAAKEAAERAVRDAEERKIRDEQDRLRKIEEDKENRIREEQLRLQEAERRARVDAESRIQEERMRLEVHAKSQQKSPMKAILGVTGVLVIVGGGLGFKMYSNHQAEMAAARAENDRVQAESRAAKAELEAKLAANQKEMDEKLAKAQTEAERAQIRLEAQQRRNEIASGHAAHSKSGGGSGAAEAKPATPRKYATKKEVSDNPLEGL